MSKIQDLRRFEIVFTTSCVYTHGVSGHLYELIDYFYIASTNGINSAILLTDGITLALFEKAVREKYDFTEIELANILGNTFESYRPKIILTKNLCIVDGSWRLNDATVYADNVFLFRCSEDEFTYWHNHKTIKRTHLMQDFKLYPERFKELNITVVDYVKKILWQRYKKPTLSKTNTALFYLTTNCRKLPQETIQALIDKHSFEHYIVLTNDPDMYSTMENDKVTVEKAPIKNLFEKFDAYIYTSTPLKSDCSPRFIVECAVYGKDVIYEIDYTDPGIERRKQAIATGVEQLQLTGNDYFIQYVKDNTNIR